MERKIFEQQQAKLLRQQGRSLQEIASHLGVAKSSVSVWTKNIVLSKNHKERLKRLEDLGKEKGRKMAMDYWVEYRRANPKPVVNLGFSENRRRISAFFDAWVPASAYVLGFFAADGCMYHSRNGDFYNGGYYIEFSSIDYQLLDLVRKLMRINNKIENKILCRDEYNSTRKKQYKLRLVSKQGFNSLLKIGFSPAKSLILTFPQMPNECISDFIRGYFDGDGYVYTGKYKPKNKSFYKTVLQSGFTSGSRKFLEDIQLILCKKACMGKGSLHANGTCWELSYSARDTKKLYNFLYPTNKEPCLLRKKVIFQKSLEE